MWNHMANNLFLIEGNYGFYGYALRTKVYKFIYQIINNFHKRCIRFAWYKKKNSLKIWENNIFYPKVEQEK